MLISRKKGFTLIELLVVIAIIALLLSILMPSLQKAKAIARSVVCRTNLRQMTMGLKLYAQDHDDKAMLFSHASGRYWFHEIAPYLGDDGYKETGGADVSTGMQTSYCPEARKTDAGVGAKKAWTYTFSGDKTTGSYGMNLWLLPDGDGYGQISKAEVDPVAEANLFYSRLTDANASVTPVFGDCRWVGGWPRGSDPVPTDVNAATGIGSMYRFAINRHDKAINVSFVDGHVDKVDLEDLWTLNWHKNFVSNTNITINY